MAFIYKTSPLGHKLTANELALLENIDDYPFQLGEFNNLGELHQRLNKGGGVTLSDNTPSYPYSYIITNEQRKSILDVLDNEVSKRKDEIERLKEEWENAHMKDDDKAVNRIDMEMRSCCRKIKELENTRSGYSRALTQSGGKTYLVVPQKGMEEVVICGRYYSNPDQVVLYHKSISSEELLAVVYVHEMIHAYLRIGNLNIEEGGTSQFIKEIEEPIVESAMLRFFELFDNGKLHGFSKNHVQRKQSSLGIAFYGFGYYIYHNANVIDYVEQYKKVKPKLLNTLPEVIVYLEYWRLGIYPFGREQECLEALYNVLHCVNIGHRDYYTVNGKGSYTMYEVVEEFVIFLQNLGHSISAINQEIQNYVNSSWIFVSSSPNTVAHHKKGQYPSIKGGFYITKQWKGNTGGNFSKLKDSINSNYPNFQIVKI